MQFRASESHFFSNQFCKRLPAATLSVGGVRVIDFWLRPSALDVNDKHVEDSSSKFFLWATRTTTTTTEQIYAFFESIAKGQIFELARSFGVFSSQTICSGYLSFYPTPSFGLISLLLARMECSTWACYTFARLGSARLDSSASMNEYKRVRGHDEDLCSGSISSSEGSKS